MAVSLRINSLLALDQLYLGACRAELYSRDIAGIFVLRQTVQVSNPDYTTNINFTQEVSGRVRVCIRKNNGRLVWRSVELDQRTDGTPFRFSIISVNKADTTFDADRFTESVELPMVNDIADLDEDMVVEELDVRINSGHIDVDGEGKIAKGEDWTILSSDFDFDYDFNLVPATSIDHTRLLRVNRVGLQLNFSNPITGIGASCMQNEINNQIRRTLQNQINTAIQNELNNHVGQAFGEDNELTNQTSATIQAVNIIQTGTTTINSPVPGAPDITVPVRSVEMIVDVSIPTELIEQQNSNSSGNGCLGIVLLPLLVGTAALLMILW